MTAPLVFEPQAGTERVGKVFATVRIGNRGDEVLFGRGMIARDHIRELAFESVLVDTFADTLCLTANAIAANRLAVLRGSDGAYRYR